jgi:hypothetical protein
MFTNNISRKLALGSRYYYTKPTLNSGNDYVLLGSIIGTVTGAVVGSNSSVQSLEEASFNIWISTGCIIGGILGAGLRFLLDRAIGPISILIIFTTYKC